MAGLACVSSACLGSDTSALAAGECVTASSVGFTFGGDVDKVSCDQVRILSDNYRVTSVGSERDVESRCGGFDLIVVDENDAACLSQR